MSYPGEVRGIHRQTDGKTWIARTARRERAARRAMTQII